MPIETGAFGSEFYGWGVYIISIVEGLYEFNINEEKFELNNHITNLLAEDTFIAQKMICHK